MKLLQILVLIFLITAANLSAQFKIGSQQSFLTESPSVTANGMGRAGAAAAVDDNYYFNPALLGLLAFDSKITSSGFLDKHYYDLTDNFEFYSGHLAVPFKLAGKIFMGIAYRYSKVGAYYEETTIDYPDGTGRMLFVGDKFHDLTLSFAVEKRIRMAVGLNLKLIKDHTADLHDNTAAFDLGIAISLRDYDSKDSSNGLYFQLNPVLGLSRNFMGSDISYDYPGIDYGGRPTIYTFYYELPTVMRVGFSSEFELYRKYDRFKWTILSILPVLEYEKYRYTSWNIKGGAQLGLGEALFLRIGTNDTHDFNSYGFSVSANGIYRFIGFLSQGNDFNDGTFISRIDIKYSYAHEKYDDDSYLPELEKSYKQLFVTFKIRN